MCWYIRLGQGLWVRSSAEHHLYHYSLETVILMVISYRATWRWIQRFPTEYDYHTTFVTVLATILTIILIHFGVLSWFLPPTITCIESYAASIFLSPWRSCTSTAHPLSLYIGDLHRERLSGCSGHTERDSYGSKQRARCKAYRGLGYQRLSLQRFLERQRAGLPAQQTKSGSGWSQTIRKATKQGRENAEVSKSYRLYNRRRQLLRQLRLLW